MPKLRLPKLSSSLFESDRKENESTEEAPPTSKATRHLFVQCAKTTFTKLRTSVGTKVIIGDCKECLVGILSEIRHGDQPVLWC